MTNRECGSDVRSARTESDFLGEESGGDRRNGTGAYLAYSLIIEEGTPFAEKKPELPDEEEERRMYERTWEILQSYGYHQYEISNYAKKGKRMTGTTWILDTKRISGIWCGKCISVSKSAFY